MADLNSLMSNMTVVIKWPLNIITMVFSILFLINFSRTKEKSYAFFMIFVMNFTSWIFPIVDFLKYLSTLSPTSNKDASVHNTTPLAVIEIASVEFCLFWTTAFAVFTHWIIANRISNLRRFVVLCVICCIALTAVFPVALYWHKSYFHTFYDGQELVITISEQKMVNWISFALLFDIFGTIVPITITSYSYYQSYKILKSASGTPFSYSGSNPRHLLYYCIAPIVCYMPAVIRDICWFYTAGESKSNLHNFVEYLIGDFPTRFWGLLNLLTFWILRPDDANSRRPSSLMFSQPFSVNSDNPEKALRNSEKL